MIALRSLSVAFLLLSLVSVQTLARPSTPIQTCTKTVVVDGTKNPNETCTTFAAANRISLENLYRWNLGLDNTGRCTNLDDGNAICVSVTPVRSSDSRPVPSNLFTAPPLSPPTPSGAANSTVISPVVEPVPASPTNTPVENTSVPLSPPVPSGAANGDPVPASPTVTNTSVPPTDVVVPETSSLSTTSGWSDTSDRLGWAVGFFLTAGYMVFLLM